MLGFLKALPSATRAAAVVAVLALLAAGYWYVTSLRSTADALRGQVQAHEADAAALRAQIAQLEAAQRAAAQAQQRSGRVQAEAKTIVREIYRDRPPVIIREECHEDVDAALAPIRGAIDRLRDYRDAGGAR